MQSIFGVACYKLSFYRKSYKSVGHRILKETITIALIIAMLSFIYFTYLIIKDEAFRILWLHCDFLNVISIAL